MKNKKNYILAFLIPLTAMIILYFCGGIIGGNKSILTKDLQDQYVAFFNAFKNILEGKTGLFYTFSKTLGGNMLGLITYYLLSPLNLLVLMFKRIDMPTCILIINILKIALSGLTSYIYFRKTFKDERLNLTFSIIYSLMAYNIVYSQNIMWLDGVILLPLIILGIDKIDEENKPILFYITLTLSIIFNYYIGYMTCIASLIYYIYKLYLKKDKINIKDTFKIIKYILLSVLTSMIVLLPSIYSLISGKASGILEEFIPNQKFAIFDLITRFYIGAFKNNDLTVGCPNLYISLIVILLVIYYFFNKKVTKKEKKAAIILISIYLISFIIYPIDVIWHTFKHPYGFPFRYSFIFDFMLLIIGYKSYIKLDKFDDKFIKKFILYSFILTIITDKLLYTSTMYYKVLATFIIITIYLMYLAKRKKKEFSILLIIMITLEMLTNDFLIITNIKYENKNEYKDFVTNYGYIIDKLNDQESFYRLEKTTSYSTNDELLLNYNGISHFSSVYEGKNNELLGKYLGIFNRFYITNYNGSTLVTNSLMNIKYILSPDTIDYYNKINTYNNINVYRNDYNLPLGFMVDKELLNLKLEEYKPFLNQENILRTMYKNIGKFYLEEKPTIKLENLKEEKGTYKKINKEKSASIIFEITPNNEGILYGYLHSKQNKKVNIKLNGKEINDINDENSFAYNVLDLGSHNESDKVILEVELLTDELKLEDYTFVTLDVDVFENAIKELNNNDKLIITEYNKGTIKAFINVTSEEQFSDGQILYTSIPYDEGFEVTVDSKKVKKEKVLDSLLALNLEKGKHEIVIKYKPRGLKSGSILSILGIILFIIIRKKEKTN